MTAGGLPVLDVPRLRPTDRLVQLEPQSLVRSADGERPGLSTAVRVGVRGGDLLVRFDGRDRGVVATLTQRDAALWKEDVFEVFLSPGQEPRIYFEFEVNPLGALFDARVESPDGRRDTMRVETSWNCAGFSARVRRRPDRWSAVVKIPLRRLSPAPVDSWRGNFYRIDRGPTDEFSAWSPTGADPPDFHVPARFGFLRMPAP